MLSQVSLFSHFKWCCSKMKLIYKPIDFWHTSGCYAQCIGNECVYLHSFNIKLLLILVHLSVHRLQS